VIGRFRSGLDTRGRPHGPASPAPAAGHRLPRARRRRLSGACGRRLPGVRSDPLV